MNLELSKLLICSKIYLSLIQFFKLFFGFCIKRYSAEQCLEHPFFASLRDPDYEINAGFQFDFDFENKKKPLAKIKGMIFDEMKTFHPSFNEHNPASYNVPILQPEQLYTLDLDGSLIYIGLEMLLIFFNFFRLFLVIELQQLVYYATCLVITSQTQYVKNAINTGK
eukprot:TRINITY_DN2927_c0_g1_i10.p2 TRINITY_DN2927_c0_g1~~TRINITY_DN2927_c0_g1_i10.p2  ORF type:complete len:167 (-),score=22.37 TRINITY_DN2927_c0_g1_i10:177-677(-)